MGRCAVLGVMLLVIGGCGPAVEDQQTVENGPARTFLQANLSGGWTDGAEVRGIDDAVAALVVAISTMPSEPVAIFLNEACESHAAHVADALGSEWQWFFVPSWPGHSDCFPAPNTADGRFGNAVLVADRAATSLVIGSCNDLDVDPDRCLPNWAPPAEQRRGICATTASTLLCSVHLDPRSWQHHDAQLHAIGEIAAALVRERGDVVIGGDLNEGRRRVKSAFADHDGVSFVHLAGSKTLTTYPASRPRRELDHILYGSTSAVAAAGAVTVDLGYCDATFHDDGRCTDHLAILAGVAH